MSDDISRRILSDITIYTKFAKHIKSLKRRETWDEICIRNMNLHVNKYPNLKDEIEQVYNNFVIKKLVLPSMRSLQFAGKPIEISPNRMFNCAYLPIDHWKAFSETMFLLLGGTGVGFSVQKHHIEKLPEIIKPTKKRRYLIGDSIEGWADAVKALIRAYLDRKSLPLFDFSDIRSKGSQLVTSGGKAPGPEPLKDCLHNIKKILDRKDNGEKLTSLDVHDIMCYIADAVLAGGIRRAACISLFNLDDEEMLTCKFGNWWENNPQRARANNSAVIVRHKITEQKFMELWKKIELSGSGEPGISFTNNQELGTNPCHEISLKPFQFCNLTEINMDNLNSQDDLNSRAKAASFIGTLQAGYTNFHYLRDIWKKTTEKDALLGVSGTGIGSDKISKYNLIEASNIVLLENERVSKLININKASRVTTIKPAGTTSLIMGTSSGIHAWHNDYYLRRIRFNKSEPFYNYLKNNHSEIIKDEYLKPQTEFVIEIPIKAPDSAITRNEKSIDLLERIKKFHEQWIQPGHRDGDNTNNVSATISIKNEEWDEVGKWMWKNRNNYNGLSVLPHFGGSYFQAPFEDISKEEFERIFETIKDIDLTKIEEIEDNTNMIGEIACAGGVCEVK